MSSIKYLKVLENGVNADSVKWIAIFCTFNNLFYYTDAVVDGRVASFLLAIKFLAMLLFAIIIYYLELNGLSSSHTFGETKLTIYDDENNLSPERECSKEICCAQFIDVEDVGDKFKITRTIGCEQNTEETCKDRFRKANFKDKILITKAKNRYILCCRSETCAYDLDASVILYEEVLLPESAPILSQLLVTIILIIFLLFPLISAYYERWINPCHVRNEYTVGIDESILKADPNPFADIRREGRKLNGLITLNELRETIQSINENKSYELPLLTDFRTSKLTYLVHNLHQSVGYDRAIVVHSKISKDEKFLNRMLEHGIGHFVFDAFDLCDVLEEATHAFREESLLIRLPSDLVIVGDLRGRYCDLLRWFQLYGYPPKRRYLFLGGLIDNDNADSLETISLIAALKVALPNDIFVLRGATEYLPFTPRKHFSRKISNSLSNVIKRMCQEMPIVAMIGNDIIAVHSGISYGMSSLESFESLEKQQKWYVDNTVLGMMFNRPKSNIKRLRRIQGSLGCYYGAVHVEKIISQLKIKLIIRARTPTENGHFFFAKRQLLTIWSANCHGCTSATSLDIDSDFRITINSLRSSTASKSAGTSKDSVTATNRVQHMKTCPTGSAFRLNDSPTLSGELSTHSSVSGSKIWKTS